MDQVAEVSDISPLLRMSALRKADLSPNPLSAQAVEQDIPLLRQQGVTVWFSP